MANSNLQAVEPDQRWLDVKAAAAHVGATVSFIRTLIWDGAIPYVRAGKKFVIDRADLDSYMTRQKERNPP
jgi:excisionase family DNA binding protein